MTGRPRIVIATPDRAECEVFADWLAEEGFEPVRTGNLRAAADEIQAHTFDMLVVDYAFAFRGGLHAVSRGRTRNPHTPTLVIGEPDASARQVTEQHNATFIERPVERSSLVCMVSMVIMEDRPVRRSVRKPVPRLEAVIEGDVFSVLDVSNEGMRLEIPRKHHSVLPPYFNVRIPIVGIGLTIQRVWVSIPPGFPRTESALTGGALADNPERACEAWRRFVDAIPAANAAGIVQLH